MSWSKNQVCDFVKAAKYRAGKQGWELLGPGLQRALLALQFTYVVTGQAIDQQATASLSRLWADMLEEARLKEE
jgi:hypothetical protein